MLPTFWEDDFVLYITSTLFATVCLLLTCLWNTKHNSKPAIAPPPLEEKDEDDIVLLAQTKPLRLAKELEEKLPKEIKILEKKVENEQLEAIYKLMLENSEQFGDTSMEDMKNQMRLYGF